MRSILVTSIGAKLPLLRVLKNARDSFDKNLTIIGADANAAAEARKCIVLFWQMPPLEALGFEGVLEYAKRHHVRYVIPTRDGELPFFAKHKAAFKAHGIAVFVANEESVAFCYDKLRFFEESQMPWAIFTTEEIDAIETPRVVVKERFGAGSQKMLLGATKREAREFAKSLESPIFQPFIAGVEYSIDAYVDRQNRCHGVIVRSRDVVVNGESQVTTRVKNMGLEAKAAAFVERHHIKGHSVLQVLVNKEGSHLIECNARFGGASTLSEYLGLKSFLWFFYEANKMAFEPAISEKIVRQTRENKEDSYSEC